MMMTAKDFIMYKLEDEFSFLEREMSKVLKRRGKSYGEIADQMEMLLEEIEESYSILEEMHRAFRDMADEEAEDDE